MGPRSKKMRAAAVNKDDIESVVAHEPEQVVSKKTLHLGRREEPFHEEVDDELRAMTASDEVSSSNGKAADVEEEAALERLQSGQVDQAAEADEPQVLAASKQLEVASGLERTPSNLQHISSGDNIASPDMHAGRRVMGAAATVGGAAGMLLMGPVSGVALGTAALYASTREDAAGAVTRKVGSAYLQLADCAVDNGLQVIDRGVKRLGQAVDKGCERLADDMDLASIPTPLRFGVNAVLNSRTRSTPISGASAEEARKIREKYPDRIPVICSRSRYSTGLPEISKNKFIVPGTMLCGEFKYMIHKHLVEARRGDRAAEQTIYVFANGLAPKTSTPMSDLYEKMRADDGFLYITYSAENTLG